MDLGKFEVALDVQDIGRALAFYETLGFRRVEGSVELRAVTLQNGDARIALYQGHLDPPGTQLIFWQGDIDDLAAQMQAKGLKVDHVTKADAGAGRAIRLRDPDGHVLYLINMPGQAPG